MSLDARYIFSYDHLGYSGKTRMEKDTEYLKEKFGGEFEIIYPCNVVWDKPKHTLLESEFELLQADHILEKLDMELWRIIK